MSRRHDDTGTGSAEHPLARFVALLEDELTAPVDAPVWSLDAATTGDLVPRLAGVVAGVQEVEARVVGHAGTMELPASIGPGPCPPG